VRGLIIRDFVTMRWYIVAGFLFGAMTLWLLRGPYASPSGFSAIWLILWFILARGLFAFDEHGKSEAIINSLPLKKWEIVAARHLSSLILLIYSFLVMSAWLGILKVIGISYPYAIPWAWVIATGVIACAIGTVILFPILFKVSFAKARWISFFIVFIFIIPLFNSLPKPTAPQTSVLMETILGVPDSLAAGAATLVFGLLTMLSILISTKLYKSREF
jgi:ABC-2 type transport system permease protein